MRHLHRRTTPPDRRAARLMTLVTPHGDGAADAAAPVGQPGRGLDALERVLAAYGPGRLLGHGGAREADRALRAAAARLAAEARAEDPVRAERLLVPLRRAWQALPAAQQVPEDARRALWDRVVRLCCEEFYRPDAARVTPPRLPAI